MSSGVAVNDGCLTAFQELKLGKKHTFIIYDLNDSKTEIVITKTSSSKEYDDFIAELPEDKCKFAVYDLQFEKAGGGIRNKICFIAWSPDTAKVKDKMVFASSKDAIRKALVGIAIEIQATDPDEVSLETVLDKASRGA